jgi:hypothetical protein
MLETLWAMAKLLFFFGFLPTGILLILYFALNRFFDIRKSIKAVIGTNKTEVGNIIAAFVWLCFIGFIGYVVYAIVKG